MHFLQRTIGGIAETHNRTSPRADEGCVCDVFRTVPFRFDPCEGKVRYVTLCYFWFEVRQASGGKLTQPAIV